MPEHIKKIFTESELENIKKAYESAFGSEANEERIENLKKYINVTE